MMHVQYMLELYLHILEGVNNSVSFASRRRDECQKKQQKNKQVNEEGERKPLEELLKQAGFTEEGE